MNSICWFCLRDLETNDGVLLCHPCYNVFADRESPFSNGAVTTPTYWENVMNDPDYVMWTQKRLENK